ncbi:MAG: hypothetical protein IJU11_08035 [Prevotella sp.]|nr:hypothetical protein [Prevotella sp.]
MWAIYNKNGERMYQYPASEYETDALRILRKAQQNNPQAGFRIKWTEEGSEE